LDKGIKKINVGGNFKDCAQRFQRDFAQYERGVQIQTCPYKCIYKKTHPDDIVKQREYDHVGERKGRYPEQYVLFDRFPGKHPKPGKKNTVAAQNKKVQKKRVNKIDVNGSGKRDKRVNNYPDCRDDTAVCPIGNTFDTGRFGFEDINEQAKQQLVDTQYQQQGMEIRDEHCYNLNKYLDYKYNTEQVLK
jgi:hypothetical protein